MKRVFSIMMALILMLSMVTASVFAETEPTSEASAAAENAESLRNYVEFTAYGALMKKKAVCQGIACLYHRMLKDAGVDACMISANGPGSSECHTWVLVKIGKKWYNTDPTFDGIEHNKDSRYKYFLKTDKSYKRLKHYLPKKPKKFTKTHPMGKKDLKF
jgi:transglutaminase/protease-like cytokinesis protein 3